MTRRKKRPPEPPPMPRYPRDEDAPLEHLITEIKRLEARGEVARYFRLCRLRDARLAANLSAAVREQRCQARFRAIIARKNELERAGATGVLVLLMREFNVSRSTIYRAMKCVRSAGPTRS